MKHINHNRVTYSILMGVCVLVSTISKADLTESVAVCHVPEDTPDNTQIINIIPEGNLLEDHMHHGDWMVSEKEVCDTIPDNNCDGVLTTQADDDKLCEDENGPGSTCITESHTCSIPDGAVLSLEYNAPYGPLGSQITWELSDKTGDGLVTIGDKIKVTWQTYTLDPPAQGLPATITNNLIVNYTVQAVKQGKVNAELLYVYADLDGDGSSERGEVSERLPTDYDLCYITERSDAFEAWTVPAPPIPPMTEGVYPVLTTLTDDPDTKSALKCAKKALKKVVELHDTGTESSQVINGPPA